MMSWWLVVQETHSSHLQDWGLILKHPESESYRCDQRKWTCFTWFLSSIFWRKLYRHNLGLIETSGCHGVTLAMTNPEGYSAEEKVCNQNASHGHVGGLHFGHFNGCSLQHEPKAARVVDPDTLHHLDKKQVINHPFLWEWFRYVYIYIYIIYIYVYTPAVNFYYEYWPCLASPLSESSQPSQRLASVSSPSFSRSSFSNFATSRSRSSKLPLSGSKTTLRWQCLVAPKTVWLRKGRMKSLRDGNVPSMWIGMLSCWP